MSVALNTIQERPQRSGATVASAMALPWLAYTVVLAVLSFGERRATPEAVGRDHILDVMINWCALVGVIVAAVWSVVAMRRAQGRFSRGILLASVIVGGFLGPLLALIVVTTVAHDVDGAMWMLVLPVLGLFLVFLSLFLLDRHV